MGIVCVGQSTLFIYNYKQQMTGCQEMADIYFVSSVVSCTEVSGIYFLAMAAACDSVICSAFAVTAVIMANRSAEYFFIINDLLLI